MTLDQRAERTESLVALIHEQFKDLKVSMDSIHGDNKPVAASTSTWPTVPVYTMEQLVALNQKLVESAVYAQLVSS